MLDFFKITDKFNVTTTKAIMVFCPYCKEHIFYIRDNKKGVILDNLKNKTNKEVITNFNCPKCKRDIRIFNGNETLLKTNKGYWK